jgi:hypothetical protein
MPQGGTLCQGLQVQPIHRLRYILPLSQTCDRTEEAVIAITIGIVMMEGVEVDVIPALDRLLVLIAAATEGTVVGIEIEIEIGMTTGTGTETGIIAGLLRKEVTTMLEGIDMTYHPNTTL